MKDKIAILGVGASGFGTYLGLIKSGYTDSDIDIYNSPNKNDDCYLAFPIVLMKKKEFIARLINSGFDLSEYFYRDCSNLKIFNQFKLNELKNINYYSNNILLLPCYPSISKKYIEKLISEIKKIDQLI